MRVGVEKGVRSTKIIDWVVMVKRRVKRGNDLYCLRVVDGAQLPSEVVPPDVPAKRKVRYLLAILTLDH